MAALGPGMRISPKRFILSLALSLGALASAARAQDTRTVTEPVFPAICSTVAAETTISNSEPMSETADTLIQPALSACTSGKAVELTLGASGQNAFVIKPIFIPNGVTLIVDGGVTVFGSLVAADYQIGTANPAGGQDQCGVNGTNGNGCNPLITLGEAAVNGTATSTNSGLMGYGVINARGGDKPVVNGTPLTESWWDLANDARTGPNSSQNNPVLLVAYKSNSASIYKITLLNSPHFHVSTHYNSGLTAWGIKILSPWTSRNTDGFDPSGATNVTITNSVIGDGDDEIAIGGSNAASNFTFSNLLLSSGHGLSIGSYTQGGVSNVLANNIAFSGQAADTNQTGLHIKSAQDRGGLVNNVTYENVCIQNVYEPIELDPNYNANSGASYPHYTNITYANVHVLSGVTPHVELSGLNAANASTINIDNVVFDSTPTFSPTWTYSTITFTNAISGTSAPQAYPSTFATHAGTGVTYTNAATVSNANAYSCPTTKFPALVGELYATKSGGTYPNTLSVTNPATITLNAVVEPTNSEKSYSYISGGTTYSYTGASVPSGAVKFFDGGTQVGTGTLAQNGTLAMASIANPTAGTHTYTAQIASDAHYSALTFGSLTVTVTAGPAAQAVFTTAPPASLTYGNAQGTVKVALQDVSGSATTSTATVTLTVTNSATGYSASYMAAAAAGTATFTLNSSLPQVGTYVYTATAAGVTSANANEAVTQATLIASANAASKIFDAANPSFTATITGFVNGDTSSVVSGSPVITTSAPRNAAPGSYPTVISQGTLSATNYNFQLVGGTLTVNGGAAQALLFNPLPAFAQGPTYQLTSRCTSGLAPSYSVTGPATISGSSLAVTGAGTVRVTGACPSSTAYAASASVLQKFVAF